MDPEGSLSYSKQPATGPYPKPDESIPHSPHYFSKIHANIILPSTPRSSGLPLPFKFSDQNVVRISHLSHTCYMLAHLTVFDLLTYLLTP
jgi:hypothetical protein